MSSFVITIDLDWACESAIELTLEYFLGRGIRPTVFITHYSKVVESAMNRLDVGLHPYFDPSSSHGKTIDETVKYIIDLPHNFSGYRCHRFKSCNQSKLAMAEAGMLLSSNVCTDLEPLAPFRDRFGVLEVPIFMEDGGYLWRGHELTLSPTLKEWSKHNSAKVIVVHPMHFVINTPHFGYMVNIKNALTRELWHNLTHAEIKKLQYPGRGIRNIINELLDFSPQFMSLPELYERSLKRHNLR